MQVFRVRTWPSAYPCTAPPASLNMHRALPPHTPAAPEPTIVHTPYGTPYEGDSILGTNQHVSLWSTGTHRYAAHWPMQLTHNQRHSRLQKP